MKEKFLQFKTFFLKHSNLIFFGGGFLFDALTLNRIDSLLDLVLQSFYLACITTLIIQRGRFENGLWQPSGKMVKAWAYESEAIHFFYGGLLSAYVIFYFKSTTLSRSVFFLGLVVVLMVANEMPQIRRAGAVMRLGLYGFCLLSYLNYLLPVIFGRMGMLIFFTAWILSGLGTWFLIKYISRMTSDPNRTRLRLAWPPAVLLLLMAVLYTQKLIPPVPLSMQYAGIFRSVTREGDTFKLLYQKPPWYAFWRKDNRDFRAREGDQIFCFTRVFAPRRFEHQIFIRWSLKNPVTGVWQSVDRIPLEVKGGRGEGFRGYAMKANYEPGKWRVDVETEDERTLGGVSFVVRTDLTTTGREWKERRM